MRGSLDCNRRRRVPSTMRIPEAIRRVLACLGCCLAVVVALPVAALGAGSLSEGAPSVEVSRASSVLGGSLVVVGSPTEGEEVGMQSEAERESPEAFAVRERSRTRYEGLGVQAGRVDRAVFPDLIDRQAGGMSSLPVGVRIVKFSGPTTAQLELPGGKRGALDSASVIAKPVADGRFAPVELGLERSGDGYRPKAPVVAVNFPDRLSAGVTAASGVSLVPTDSRGVPLHASEGSLLGVSVVYANSGTDTDTVAKPTSMGFGLDAILRSERSPRTLYYGVRVAHGERLRQGSNGQVDIVGARGEVGRIPAPAAHDASGAAVPVTMSVVGNTLVVKVGIVMNEVQWPIDVDPEYWGEDKEAPGWWECFSEKTVCYEGMHNWKFIGNEAHFKMELAPGYNGYWYPYTNYNAGELAGIAYQTQGESRVYAFHARAKGEFARSATVDMEIVKSNGEVENRYELWSGEHGVAEVEGTMCAIAREAGHLCERTEGAPNNIARFITYLTQSGEAGNFWNEVREGNVYVAQSKGPEAHFNTTSPMITVNGTSRPNVLYGSGAWLGPVSGAVGVSASDPGVGVSAVRLMYGPFDLAEVNIGKEGKCEGLQCEPTYSGSFTYNRWMEEGEHFIHHWKCRLCDGKTLPSGRVATILLNVRLYSKEKLNVLPVI